MSTSIEQNPSRRRLWALALATASMALVPTFGIGTPGATADGVQQGEHAPSGSATLYRDCPVGDHVGAGGTIAVSGSTLHAYVSGNQTYTRAFSGRIALSVSPFNYATVNFSSNRDFTSVQTACG